MGWRFRKSVKIAPGIRANISKSGVSYSIGGPGSTVNIGRGKIRRTVGIPGTGISHTSETRLGSSDSTLVWLLKFMPLWVFAAFLMHWTYDPMKRAGWDTATIWWSLAFASLVIIFVLRWLALIVPVGLAILAGAFIYGGGVIYAELSHQLDQDSISVAVFACIAAAIGAWSFGSCHAALVGNAQKRRSNSEVVLQDDEADESESVSQVGPNSLGDPRQYEQMITKRLGNLGWEAQVVGDIGNFGIDVVAVMREKTVIVRCSASARLVDEITVQEVYASKNAENSDYGAIVSSSGYTRSAHQIAESTRVVLLDDDHLEDLEQQIFGTETWRDIRRPSEETALIPSIAPNPIVRHAVALVILGLLAAILAKFAVSN